MGLVISTYCSISNGIVDLNGQHFMTLDDSQKLKSLYKKLEIDYPKFYKMDSISKLGLLGVEVMKQDGDPFQKYQDNEIALVFQTEKGCLESDLAHQAAIEKKVASPAIFVYTLASIVLGEITIRNKWYGESAVFVDLQSNLSTLLDYSRSLLSNGKASACIIGLIDSFEDDNYLKLALIERSNGPDNLNKTELEKIFN